MRYCASCVMPDTRPDLLLDKEGVCNACRSYASRKSIDWNAREQELKAILEKYKSKDNSNWDCIVPVSGGKDSTYQVLKILELGYNPLCVTATTCHLSDLGRKNIENLKSLGVDYIEMTPNPNVRKKLNKFALTTVGDISWPEHVSIFTVPIWLSVARKIPLIIWGENAQNEYGGPAGASKNNTLTRKWLEEFGGLLGLRVSDMVGVEGITKKDLIPYTYPTDQELKSVGTTGIYLGYYLPWDGYTNLLIAQSHGLTTFDHAVEGSIVNYENLDNHQAGIHEYFMYLKYGFGRASSVASLHIRRGRLSRHDAALAIKRNEGLFPQSFLGKPLIEILSPLGISIGEFTSICDRFTNKDIFLTDSKGNLVKDSQGNLTKKLYAE